MGCATPREIEAVRRPTSVLSLTDKFDPRDEPRRLGVPGDGKYMEDRETTPGTTPPAGDGTEDSDSPETNDLTLGGYLDVHERPPAFSGSDEQPYTTSVEIESVENLATPYVGYLVFPRWAETGLGIVGHVETPVLWEGRSRDEVQAQAHALPLTEVKRLLDEAIQLATQSDGGVD